MSTNSPNSSPLEQMTSFMLSRARDVGVTETQILQLLGFKGGVGPIETLFSGRAPSETLPEIALGIQEGTNEVIRMARGQVESAIPVVVLDNLKPMIRKIAMLDEVGVRNLDIYVNFLISQGLVKR